MIKKKFIIKNTEDIGLSFFLVILVTIHVII